MFNPLNLFGAIGGRTKNIITVITTLAVFVKPVLDGAVTPAIHWAAGSHGIDWALKLLAGMGLVAFADKWSPNRLAENTTKPVK